MLPRSQNASLEAHWPARRALIAWSVVLLAQATWPELDTFRERISAEVAAEKTLCAAAQRFVTGFRSEFPSIALARLFAVVPFSSLPQHDVLAAERFAEHVDGTALLLPNTPVLSLLGTAGAEPSWNDRLKSQGHLAIPLLSRELVEGIPMIAQLLSDIGVGLSWLDPERVMPSRRLVGSMNQCFYVGQASSAKDARGRLIIPSQSFVADHRIQTVFGMAGSYVDSTLVAAILFSTEKLEKAVVDRYPSMIANFKMATSALATQRRLYE